MLNLSNYQKLMVLLVSILFFIGIILLFGIKYNVRQESKRLSRIENEIEKTINNIRVLKAELTYLMRPEYIQQLSDKYLGLTPISKSHIIDLNDLDDFNDEMR